MKIAAKFLLPMPASASLLLPPIHNTHTHTHKRSCTVFGVNTNRQRRRLLRVVSCACLPQLVLSTVVATVIRASMPATESAQYVAALCMCVCVLSEKRGSAFLQPAALSADLPFISCTLIVNSSSAVNCFRCRVAASAVAAVSAAASAAAIHK